MLRPCICILGLTLLVAAGCRLSAGPRLVWRQALPADAQVGFGCAGPGRVVLAVSKREVWILDTATGRRAWSRTFPAGSIRFARASAVGDPLPRLYVAHVAPRGEVLALDWKDGRVVWRAPVAGADELLAGSRHVVVGVDGGLLALDASTGRKLWERHHSSAESPTYRPLTLALGYLYALRSLGSVHLIAIDPDTGKQGGEHLVTDAPSNAFEFIDLVWSPSDRLFFSASGSAFIQVSYDVLARHPDLRPAWGLSARGFCPVDGVLVCESWRWTDESEMTQTRNGLVGVDTGTGRVLWRREEPEWTDATLLQAWTGVALVMPYRSGRPSDQVVAVRARDGAALWRLPLSDSRGTCVADGRLITVVPGRAAGTTELRAYAP